MRLVSFAATFALLLAGLLTWLMLKGLDEKDNLFFQAQSIVDVIAVGESRLQRDLLRAQTELLKNYNPLDDEIEGQRTAAATLKALMPGDAEVGEIASAIARQSDLVEHFKSANALLQNSIAYFDALSDHLSQVEKETSLLQAIASLEIRVSELTHEGKDTREDLRVRLETLSASHLPGEKGAELASILAHGRLLLALIPKVQMLASEVMAASSETARRDYSETQQHRRSQREEDAQHYHMALYVSTLALLAILARVGLVMQKSIVDLRKTAKYQQVLASASSHFLGAQFEEMQTRTREVLALLSHEMGVDRSCLVKIDDPSQSVQWTRPGLTSPDDWPSAIVDLAPLIAAAPSDVMFLDEMERTGQSELRRRLMARGLKSWSCARLHRGDRIVGFLCLERASKMPKWSWRSRSLLSVARDMFSAASERQRNIQEQREKEAALRQAQRLEAIGTFTSGVAHNINNVLNVILGHAEIAADALPEKTSAAYHLKLLMQAGGRAKEIVSQILAFGRRGRSRQHATSLDVVLADTKAQLEASRSGSMRIRINGDIHGASVWGEPYQLQQLLLNLLRNATQASLPDDLILVEVDQVTLRERVSLSHGGLEGGEYARVSVTDHGHGMDKAILEQIFDPFFTTRPGGTGLGLATAYEFVQNCGGAFDVSSEPGKGSKFVVWLPTVSPPSGATAASPACGTLMVVSRTRSAVLEDEEMLAALGFEPVGFADTNSALAALREEPTRFDLLIVDSRLPGSSGLAFARRAQEIAARPVVLSISTDIMDPRGPSDSAIVDVIQRPWRSAALHAILSRHLKTVEP